MVEISQYMSEIRIAQAAAGFYNKNNQDVIDWYYTKCKVRDAGWAIDNAKFGVVIEAEAEYQTSLVEKYKEFRDKLTMCKPEEFDALYDQFAAEYAEAGYQAIAEERLAAYQAGNSTKLLNQTAEPIE